MAKRNVKPDPYRRFESFGEYAAFCLRRGEKIWREPSPMGFGKDKERRH
jgi:hypothetical protein